jgi:hypothetical protein
VDEQAVMPAVDIKVVRLQGRHSLRGRKPADGVDLVLDTASQLEGLCRRGAVTVSSQRRLEVRHGRRLAVEHGADRLAQLGAGGG